MERTNYRGYGQPAQRPVARVPQPPAKPIAQAPAEPPVKKRRIRKTTAPRPSWFKYLVVLLVICLIAWLAHGYITTKNQLEQQKNGAAGQTEAQQLIGKVGQLVQLPQGETPTIATVNNASSLKNQAFFANAQNGDKVLIYSKSGQAVLYRPSTNKVIEFSTVNLTGT